MRGPLPLPLVIPGSPDGKPVTAWYLRGCGYYCGDPGENHTALAIALIGDGVFSPPAEDGDEVFFTSLQDAGWLRVGVIGPRDAATAFVYGTRVGHRAPVVQKVVGDLFDLGVVGFHTRLEAGQDAAGNTHFGQVLDSL